VLFVVTTLLFLDFASFFSSAWANGVLYLQFVPSLMKFLTVVGIGAAGFVVTIFLTLLFGRVYCSSICPLGTFQDVVSFVARKVQKKKFHRRQKAFNAIRYSMLALTVVAALGGSLALLNLLDPFSSFGRIISSLFKPILIQLNNATAFALEQFGLYIVYPVEVKAISLAALIVPIVLLCLIVWMSYRHGRLYCNTLCPVGALLGLMSKFSLYKIAVDADSCIGCNLCEQVCKSGCIDKKAKLVDFTRCVGCYNCFTVCTTEGLVFEKSYAKPSFVGEREPDGELAPTFETDFQRRDIVIKSLLFLAGTTSVSKKRIISTKESTVKVVRTTPVAPPGAASIDHFTRRCTACSLCVSACPTQVIAPSLFEYGVAGIMQPRMNYLASFCNFECTACTEICPSGALLPLAKEQKKLTQLGAAKFVKENCIVETEGTECGACSEHCPTKAVNMVPYKNKKLFIPEVKEQYCIGCGACEFACPTKPYKAIFVDGKPVHTIAKKAEVKKLEEKVLEEFPF
jgi:ferredoxin